MKVGDRVTTPVGDGVVVRFWYDRRLIAGQPHHQAWIRVQLDDDGQLYDIEPGQAVPA